MFNKKILVVDDEKDQVNLIKLILEQAGYEIITCGESGNAIELAKKKRVDLMILDINMPGMNGFEVLGALKLNEKTSKIPVIICSARHDFDSCQKAIEKGAANYLFKPYDIEQLLSKVKKALK